MRAFVAVRFVNDCCWSFLNDHERIIVITVIIIVNWMMRYRCSHCIIRYDCIADHGYFFVPLAINELWAVFSNLFWLSLRWCWFALRICRSVRYFIVRAPSRCGFIYTQNSLNVESTKTTLNSPNSVVSTKTHAFIFRSFSISWSIHFIVHLIRFWRTMNDKFYLKHKTK